MRITEKLGSKLVSQMIIGDAYGWPPLCTGFLYQPERPVIDKGTSIEDSLREHTFQDKDRAK